MTHPPTCSSLSNTHNMRIGISTSVIQRGQTGIAQYVFALLRALFRTGREHRYILFILEEDLPMFEFARAHADLVVVPERYRAPVKNIFWHQRHLPKLAKQHRLDILHIPSYRRLLWSKPCALVGTIHDLAPYHVRNKYDWKRMLYARVVARRLAHRQDEVIATSQNTAHDIRRFFRLPLERITVIHNGVDRDRFSPGSHERAKAEAARRYRFEKPFFLYVARLEHPGKNHLRLISAFERFKSNTGSDWQLVFGGSDWHGAERIQAAMRRSPCSSDIRSLGFVPDDQLPDLYRAADAFVYPSLYEGFGMPPLEAMACGCPAICSARCSLGEVVADAAAIVDPENAVSISEALTLVAQDENFRERLRAAGFARAREFDWNVTAANTLKVYERAATGLNSRAAREGANELHNDTVQHAPSAPERVSARA
jgi:glycosyltransferase involved in cell wall biosynthesis